MNDINKNIMIEEIIKELKNLKLNDRIYHGYDYDGGMADMYILTFCRTSEDFYNLKTLEDFYNYID